MPSATVHLLRHGEVPRPRGTLVYGRPAGNATYSRGGRPHAAEAARDGPRAGVCGGENIVLIASCPLTRTRETAAPVAGGLVLDIRADERLMSARQTASRACTSPGGSWPSPRRWPHLLQPPAPFVGASRTAEAGGAHGAREPCGARPGSRAVGGAGAQAVAVSVSFPSSLARLSVEGHPCRTIRGAGSATSRRSASLTFRDVKGTPPRSRS
ncbi:histidine phosphatase family protein [Kocuria rhizophila]|nr:histidine phosphatase family protein [Kocuria rhizophila]